MKNVIVYGYYHNDNIGDQAFISCFKNLWPQVNFTFVNEIDPSKINNYDIFIAGGGDLLDQYIKNCEKVKIPIALIGIGWNFIHPKNQYLVEKAKVIITRNDSPYHVANDLCFSLPTSNHKTNVVQSRLITILLNDFLTPRKDAPEWISVSNAWFTSEFSSVCDDLIIKGYKLQFIPMCTNPTIDDRRCAGTLISKLNKRADVNWELEPIKNFDQFKNILTKSEFVITQRLHGSIFSYLCNTQQLVISHHDKMHRFCNSIKLNSAINYYGFNKEIFFKNFNKTSYNEDRELYLSNTRQRWIDLSHIVTKEFFL